MKWWTWVVTFFRFVWPAAKKGVEKLDDACALLDDLESGLPEGKHKDKARAVCKIVHEVNKKVNGGKV